MFSESRRLILWFEVKDDCGPAEETTNSEVDERKAIAFKKVNDYYLVLKTRSGEAT